MADQVRRVRTDGLSPQELDALRALMDAAFPPGNEGFGDHDWEHAVGGTHFLVEVDGEIVSHASVVERTLEIGGRPVRAAYVEAVATAPDRQGRGHGTAVMRAVGDHIRDHFELGALGTGAHHFYERLGWETWQGQAFVRAAEGLTRTPDEEGYILVLRTPTSPAFGLTEPITCDWRPGDVW